MQCENCGKRPATVHFTEIAQGQKTEYHLCEACAHERGAAAYQAMAGAFSVNQLLSGLMNLDPAARERSQATAPRCESCGLTFQQFSQIGKFGCPDCYRSFGTGLESLLKRVQSSDEHVGKIPKRHGGTVTAKRELQKLRQQMQARIAEEQFEEAAQLRDRIRQLEIHLQMRG